MGFRISDFYEKAITKDFSRKHQLRVISIGGIVGPEHNVYITTANLPGYEINNVPTPFMGMEFNVPGTGKFPGSSNWQVTFRCDLNFDIRSKFDAWQRQIFTAIEDPNIESMPGSTGYYHIPDQSHNILLGLHDRDGNFYRKYNLVGCYPQSVAPMQYDQTDAGTLATFDVVLAYQYWELEHDTGAGIDNLMQEGMSIQRSQL